MSKPPWKTDEDSDDFYPANWRPEEEQASKPLLCVPPLPEKGKWHRNWFSNMMLFDEPLDYEGIRYKSVENFYQAMKLPRDRQDLRAEIAALEPRKSKTEIRDKSKYAWDSNWTTEKSLKVMEYALRHKFFPGTSWHKKLMETGDEPIVEFNNWNDTFWGVDIATQQGENHLGKLLMKLRSEYKNTKVINKSSGGAGIFCGRGSMFGNPYTSIKEKETKAEFIVETRQESLDKFREYFYKRVAEDKGFKKAVLKLRGETLICYCKPLDCHVDIIIEWIFKQIQIDGRN